MLDAPTNRDIGASSTPAQQAALHGPHSSQVCSLRTTAVALIAKANAHAIQVKADAEAAAIRAEAEQAAVRAQVALAQVRAQEAQTRAQEAQTAMMMRMMEMIAKKE